MRVRLSPPKEPLPTPGVMMSIIDKQRIAAVATLEALGYKFSKVDGRRAPSNADDTPAFHRSAEADAMHTLLMARADALEGCTDGSPEEAELKAVADALVAYEAKR
jgi:hypothetical protein